MLDEVVSAWPGDVTRGPGVDDLRRVCLKRLGARVTAAAAAMGLVLAQAAVDGPATLVAFWWVTASPVPRRAVKNVSAAGTYSVTWTSTPIQGAQLWQVAAQ
jgi:hypothetical protein